MITNGGLLCFTSDFLEVHFSLNDLEREQLLDRMNSRSRVIQPGERRVVDSATGSSKSRPRMSQGQRRALREHVRDLAPADRQILRERIQGDIVVSEDRSLREWRTARS